MSRFFSGGQKFYKLGEIIITACRIMTYLVVFNNFSLNMHGGFSVLGLCILAAMVVYLLVYIYLCAKSELVMNAFI